MDQSQPWATRPLAVMLSNLHSCRPHFFDGLIDVARLEVDAAAGGANQRRFKAEAGCIEGGEFDAIIRRESQHMNFRNAAFLEVIAQAGGFSPSVVEKTAVAVDARIGAFAEDGSPTILVESGDEIGSGCSLDTMSRPENLRETIKVNYVAGLVAGMIGHEAAVIGGMPILRGDDEVVVLLQFVDQRHEGFPFRNSKGAAFDEVVLEIDDDEGSHGGQSFRS